MQSHSIVTLDIGGTTINVGRYRDGQIEQSRVADFAAHAPSDAILQFLIACIDQVKDDDCEAIAIGVPCIVDAEKGLVLDAVNIPAWQRYPLKKALSEHYQCDIYLDNDVNCFTVGEFRFGAGKQFRDVVGICLGTGFGSGFIVNQQLYHGHNCSAGEVGGISYLTGTIDDYCSGQFFFNYYQMSGAQLATLADAGDIKAIDAFVQFGRHLAKAISYILFIIDPQLIVIGGSVAGSYHHFIDALWQELKQFPYQVVIDNLTIVKSELADAALLGVADLYLTQSEG